MNDSMKSVIDRINIHRRNLVHLLNQKAMGNNSLMVINELESNRHKIALLKKDLYNYYSYVMEDNAIDFEESTDTVIITLDKNLYVKIQQILKQHNIDI